MSVQHSPKKDEKNGGNAVKSFALAPPLLKIVDNNEAVSFPSLPKPFGDGVRSATSDTMLSGDHTGKKFEFALPEKFNINRRITRQTSASMNSLDSALPKKRKHQNSNTSIDSVFDEFATLFSALQRSYDQIDNLTLSINQLVTSNAEMKKFCESVVLDNAEIKKNFAELTDSHNRLLNEIKMIKSELIKTPTATTIASTVTSNIPSYASIVNKSAFSETPISNDIVIQAPALTSDTTVTKNIIVIKPKDVTQENDTTMTAIKNKISPTKKKIVKVKKAAKGGIVIECESKEAVENLKADAESKLGEEYNVTVPEKRLPKFRIFGISEKMEIDEIITKLREQNQNLIREDSTLNISSVTAANNSDRFFFKMACDPKTFSDIFVNKKLRIGWDICKAEEIVEVRRCYNCNTYGHLSKSCKSKKCCPRCTGEHDLADCVSTESKCINCINANTNLNMALEVNHAVFSNDCPAYQRQVARQRKWVNYKTE